jgi:hypothetical protein
MGVSISDDTSCLQISELQDPSKIPSKFDKNCFYGPDYSDDQLFTTAGLESFKSAYDE